jgi:hypothetical protein
MQLTHLIRHASRVIPVTSNTPNRHMHTTIRVADACDDQGRPIATRITMNTVSAKTSHTYITHLIEFGYPSGSRKTRPDTPMRARPQSTRARQTSSATGS